MKVATKKCGEVTVFVLSQEPWHSGLSFHPLCDSIADIDTSCKPRILVDMRNVAYVDALAVSELLDASKTVTKAGGVMKLLLLPGSQTRLVLYRVLLNEILKCYEDERAALESF